mgnify:CR=1 FL=1
MALQPQLFEVWHGIDPVQRIADLIKTTQTELQQWHRQQWGRPGEKDEEGAERINEGGEGAKNEYRKRGRETIAAAADDGEKKSKIGELRNDYLSVMMKRSAAQKCMQPSPVQLNTLLTMTHML